MSLRDGAAIAVALRPEPAAVREAREAVRARLTDVEPTVREKAELVVSELVGNAVRHGGLDPRDRIEVCLRPTRRGITVEVTDAGRGFDTTAVRPEPREDGAGGYGLVVLEHLAVDWGVTHPPTRVWAELAADVAGADENGPRAS